jgi:peptide/nickel transport system substrate-binding protein
MCSKKSSKSVMFLLITLTVLSLLAACAAPTPEVIEKEVVVEKPVIETVVVEKEKIVEKPVVETVVVEKEKVVEKPVVETVVVEKEVIVEKPVIETQLPVEVPRDKVFVLDQIFRYAVIDNFNFFVPGPASPTQQGLVYDTLWYLDAQTGESINSLAKEKAIYNDDYTQMTVNLREGVYWSDGVEFTADDLVFTVNTLKNTPGMMWAADMALYVKDVTKTDDYTVVFTLNEPNSRLHYYFTPGYNAIYMMAKHAWEKAEDPKTFANFPPVSLGAYLYEDSDPAGYWVLFKRRDDWERTTPGMLTGKPGPEYILTIFYGGSERKAIAMSRHELDLFMDVDYEAFKAILETTPTARSWFKDFPWAYPNELDSRYFGFNHTLAPYDNKDVRWALTLATDIVDLQTNYIGGVTRVTPIPLPATTLMMDLYALPLEPWLKELTIDVGNGETFKPYDPDVPRKIAEWAKEQGYTVPEDAEGLRDRFGMGWWKYAPDIAEKLLINNGFTKGADGKWLLPDGTPWKIKMIAAPDEADAYRLAIGFQDQMRKFGINVEVESLERDPYYTRQLLGDFEATSAWVAFRVLASPDLWYGLNTMHSRFFTPVGEPAPDITINPLRVKSPELDRIIDEMGALSPDDPKATELAQEALKWWVENMITTTTISFKKFITMDEYYWTGWPTAERPDWQPLYWFMGGRFPLMYVELVEK